MEIHLAGSLRAMKPDDTPPSPGPRLFSVAATAENAVTWSSPVAIIAIIMIANTIT